MNPPPIEPSRVFVVVPAFNEASALPAALAPLIAAGYRVAVVDDGSRDDTWQVLQSLPVYSLRHPLNLGQGAALQTGMTFAIARGADFIVHFDSDGQHQADDLPGLLAPLIANEADIALGSRFLRPEDAAAIPRQRRILLRAGRLINALLTGVWLTDAHNGLRAMTADAARNIQLLDNRYSHATEILTQIRRRRLRYVERPTRIIYTEYSRMKGQSGWNSLNVLLDLLLGRLFR